MNTSKIRKAIEARIAQLEAELEKLGDVEAMESRYLGRKSAPKAAVAQNPEKPNFPPPPTNELDFPENDSYKFTRAIDDILKQFQQFPPHEGFTRNEVVIAMRKKYPTVEILETSVSSHLWKLKRDGKLISLVTGHGKKPTVYAWPGTTLPRHDGQKHREAAKA
jgi:hypothetical protein